MMHLNEAGNYTLISIKKQKAVSRANYLLRTVEFRIKRLTPKGIHTLDLYYLDDLAHHIVIDELRKLGYDVNIVQKSKCKNIRISW